MVRPYIPLRQAFAPMYAMPHVTHQMRAWWQEIRRVMPLSLAWSSAGALSTAMPMMTMPTCLLAQTCGYPLMTQLHRKGVRPLGCFEYDIPHTYGHEHGSVLVVREDSPYESLEQLRGKAVAVNTYCSNTGMNLLRHAVAPLAEGKGRRKQFFSRVLLTGSHRGSMRAVRWHMADIAAIDAVTWHWRRMSSPANQDGLRVIGETEVTAALPWVAGAWVREEARIALWTAMQEAFEQPILREDWKRLGIVGLREVSLQDYMPVLGLEAAALDRGYRLLK